MSKRQHPHTEVVLPRADLFYGPDITTKVVYSSREVVEREVARLNELHDEDTVRYWWSHSRFFDGD